MATVPLALKAGVESKDKLTELLWQDALSHLGSTNNEVLLPINVIDMISQNNVNKIKTRLSALIGAPVVAFVDETINALRVMRTPAFSGTAVSVASPEVASGIKLEAAEAAAPKNERTTAPVRTAKVPRPPNAFILYRQHHHPQLKEAHPNLSNNEISIILGKQWKAESEDVRVGFRSLADDLKKKHAEAHPDYQYTPRKPSEKKRRASGRQQPKTTAEMKSPEPTTISTAATTPSVDANLQMEAMVMEGAADPFVGYNMVMGPDAAMAHDQFPLDAETLETLIQQAQSDYGSKGANNMVYGSAAAMEGPYAFNDRAVGDSLEFSDFITDLF
ncbi:mating-type HMG-box protein MAT1-2 [Aspergillus heteromorphus CBS 117.55]|uniref:Mating-type HMG-box protein MAT1-2 n=1 Tax=Aspergillus heteromorphus CBS 117.55 TaxID=1448321 RepID=A0A317V3T5_9EURO|nr:mating-type HMG-box protein MAT1-2 [Aspergillus heteromorphus CBS 117.55]PWY67507.1 mating-type HMG-box protein MAT1-2 [Aspergillus heteromorphus CBS 117.55]